MENRQKVATALDTGKQQESKLNKLQEWAEQDAQTKLPNGNGETN